MPGKTQVQVDVPGGDDQGSRKVHSALDTAGLGLGGGQFLYWKGFQLARGLWQVTDVKERNVGSRPFPKGPDSEYREDKGTQRGVPGSYSD